VSDDGWKKVTLGRTGLVTSRLGLGSSYGIDAPDVERAFERGINYFYWGSTRTEGFGRGLTAIARKRREDAIIVVQSYARFGTFVASSFEKALRQLAIEYADVLLLGLWNSPPPERVLASAHALVEAGKARHVIVSCHHRPTFEKYIRDPRYGAIMLRYNAAHRGAEREVFPKLAEAARDGVALPGVVAYTATRWTALIDPQFTPPGEKTPLATDCYRFALSRPEVNVCIAGPRNGADLDQAMAALDLGPMSEDELAWIRRVGDHVHAKAKQTTRRGALRFLDLLTGSPLGGGDDARR